MLGMNLTQSLLSRTSQVRVARWTVRQTVLCDKCFGDSGTRRRDLSTALGRQAGPSRGSGSPLGMIPHPPLHSPASSVRSVETLGFPLRAVGVGTGRGAGKCPPASRTASPTTNNDRAQALVMLTVEKPWSKLRLTDGCKWGVLGKWVFGERVGCGGEGCGRKLASKTSLSVVLRRSFLTTVN